MATPQQTLSKRLLGYALRAWRLLALGLFGWLLALKAPSVSSTMPEAAAKAFFPTLQSLNPEKDGYWLAQDAAGNRLGRLCLTLPSPAPAKGYRGPAQVLIAQTETGQILGWKLLESPDTPEHIDKVVNDANFQKTLTHWTPGSPEPRIDAVSGATLTSLAIAEGILQRVSGTEHATDVSRKFPEPISLLEARRLFPEAASMRKVGAKYLVINSKGTELGWLSTGAPQTETVDGYQGPTDLLIAQSMNEATILGVRLRRSFDNEEYVDRIRQDERFLPSFTQRTTASVVEQDFTKSEVQGVSGATLTSYAIAEGLKRRLTPPAPAPKLRPPIRWWSGKEISIALFALGGVAMALTKLRGYAWLRWAWQALVILGLGWWLGAPISLHYLAGWTTQGWNLASAGMALLGMVALLGPWATGRQIYCHQLCPHGQLQVWLGKWSPWRISVPPQLHKWLQRLPAALLGAAVLSLALRWKWNLVLLEAFDAWVPSVAHWLPITLALLGLAAALVVPQAYCKYACPTGALLKWLRFVGPQDRWNRQDTIAACLLVITAVG